MTALTDTDNSSHLRQETDHGTLRSQRIKLAFLTSVGSKLANIGTQVVAYPIAIHALGRQQFGVYVTLASSVAWLGMSNIGIGPGLTRETTGHLATRDRPAEIRDFSSAFFAVLLLVTLVTAVLALGLSAFSISAIFGKAFAPYSHEMRQGLILLLGILFIQVICSVAEALQAAYQEQHITNLWGMLGNIVSLIALLVTAVYSPHIVSLILAVNGAVALSKLLNLINLVFINHPHLLPRIRFFALRRVKVLLKIGLMFSLGQLSGLLCHQLSNYFCARLFGPLEVASFAAMMQVILLGVGMISMIVLPLWPAIADAVARKDIEWAERGYRKAARVTLVYGASIGLLLIVFGQQIMSLWFHLRPPIMMQVFMGLYFAALVWEYLHYFILVGLGNVRQPSLLLLARSLLMVPTVFLLARVLGSASIAAGLAIPTLCLTSWLFPRWVERTLHEEKAARETFRQNA